VERSNREYVSMSEWKRERERESERERERERNTTIILESSTTDQPIQQKNKKPLLSFQQTQKSSGATKE
jgi:hypothetical protein